MATHSSNLAWEIPWTEEPGELQSTRSQSQTRLSEQTTAATTTPPPVVVPGSPRPRARPPCHPTES